MGPELAAAMPYLLAAGGTVASLTAAEQQADDRRRILNQQLERDEQATDKSTALVQEEGKRFDQQERMKGLEQSEAKTYEQTQADLAGAGGGAIAAAADSANVSGDFLQTKAARAIEEGTRLTSIARESAKARAPGMLQFGDSLKRADLAGKLQNLWGSAGNMNRASRQDAESVQEPVYGSLGRIATAAGGAMASGGYGAAPRYGAPPNPYAGINFGGGR